MGIAIIFAIISTFVAIYYVNERATTVLNSRKLDLVRTMSPNQEKIRLWANLEMNEALTISLQDIKKIDFIKGVDVRALTSDQFKDLKEDKYKLVIPSEIDSNLPYYLVFRIDQTSNVSILSTLLIPLVVFLFTFTLIYFSIVFVMTKIFKPLSLLISDDLDTNENKKSLNIEATGEIGVLISKIQKSQQDKIQLESEKNNFKLATQLAHDIRSPLEVLKSLKDEMISFPDSSKKRIQLSINRIEEIAFNLLKTHKQSHGIGSDLKSEELLSILGSVVTEKNIEYRNTSGIEIVENLDSNSYGLFSKIQRSTLKSIISNLINNGIESINGNTGIIEIGLVSENNKNVIKVIDNGPAISSEVQAQLFTKGFTTKKNGHGLGLFNAKQDIEAVGGTIVCESEVGKGTTFTIILPKSETPATFIESIDAYKYERIIVLDDDPAFHEVWAKRLEGLESKVEHIHSVEEMLSKYQALHPKILLLSDFELMDKHLDGIDTILKLGYSEHSVLVTARNEEKAIQDRCLAAGIKLLPKSLVNYIGVVSEPSGSSKHIDASKLGDASMVRTTGMPMVINTRFGMQAKAGAESLPIGSEGIGDGPDLAVGAAPAPEALNSLGQVKLDQVEGSQGRAEEAYNKYAASGEIRSGDVQIGSNLIVLIDDDRLVHLNWKSHCKKNGLDFHGFYSIEAFISDSTSFDNASRIYIDSNLGDGIKGEIESEKIFALGFLNLYLATGYEKDSIAKPSWIKEIYSKSPEFIG